MNSHAKNPADRSRKRRFNIPLPALTWLRHYEKTWLRGDLVAGLGRGFSVSGGMSQSVVNAGGGARTPLWGAFAAALALVVVPFHPQACWRFARLLSNGDWRWTLSIPNR